MLKLLVFPFTTCWMLGTIPKIPFRRHPKDSCPAPRVLCALGTPSGKSVAVETQGGTSLSLRASVLALRKAQIAKIATTKTDFDGLMSHFRKETFVRGALGDPGRETPY